MYDHLNLQDFLEPVLPEELFGDQSFNEYQFGHLIRKYETHIPELDNVSIVLLGIGEQRGDGFPEEGRAPDAIRRQFYTMYHWHKEIGIADLGNIRRGKTVSDTYAALKTITRELLDQNKVVFIFGGSHDLTLAQYQAYASREQIIEATVVDALIDLHEEEIAPSRHFLMEMLTGHPNFIRHYNHIGIQSYFIHPRLLETLDKLRFDFYRVGRVREHMESMEPVIRQSEMVSFDMCALKAADAPACRLSPNGFTGDEACALMRYAGMSAKISSVGLYGYRTEADRDELTALQAAQMLWYFIDGRVVAQKEQALQNRQAFNEFHVSFEGGETSFLKSKYTGRWWMRLPNEEYIPCAYEDYLLACKSQIPERWMRAQERL